MTRQTTAKRNAKNPTTQPTASQAAQRLAVAGYALLVGVIGCVAAMSWNGLVGFATSELRLTTPFAYLVPVSLDGAALTTAFLAMRSMVLGDSAGGARVMTLAFVGASAWFNIVHATQNGGLIAAEFFGGMSVAVWAIFELVMRLVRRDALRAAGALERPLARFRPARWLRFPAATFRAWSAALDRGITDPNEALALIRKNISPPVPNSAAITVTDSPDMPKNKAAAVREALKEIGGNDVTAAIELLASRGIQVDRSYAYNVARTMASNNGSH